VNSIIPPILIRAPEHRQEPPDRVRGHPSAGRRLQRHSDQRRYQDRGIELSNQCFRHCERSRNAMYWISITISHTSKRGEAEVDQTARFPSQTSSDRGLVWIASETLLHEQLNIRRPSQPDEQIGDDPPMTRWQLIGLDENVCRSVMTTRMLFRIPSAAVSAQVAERRVDSTISPL